MNPSPDMCDAAAKTPASARALARRCAEGAGRWSVEALLQKLAGLQERAGQATSPERRWRPVLSRLLALARDYRNGRYRAIPYGSLTAAALAALYLLGPKNLSKKALPGVGKINTAALAKACLRLVEQDLLDYEAWRGAPCNADSPPQAT